VRRFGEGRVFYTALGHFESTWLDPRFQQMLESALLWITGLVEGDASVPPRGPVEVTLPAEIAPGAALEIYGSGLTTGSSLEANPLEWKYRLAGTRVLVNGSDAPLYYASPEQLNVQFPLDLTPGSRANVAFTVGEKVFEAGDVPVVEAAPVIRGIREGANHLEIYVTGLGSVDQPIAAGAAAPLDRLIRTRLQPRVRVDGSEAEVQFSGLAPGWVALYQVNALLPAPLPAGEREIELEAAGRLARFSWRRR
jgi:hypothetical protein